MNTSPERRVTVLLPGLFDDLPVPDEPELASVTGSPLVLETLLARADRADGGPPGFEPRLLRLFGVPASRDGEIPVAPVTRLADMGVIDREWWVRADPVYLEPGHDSLVLHADLHLTPAEAESLAGEINATLSDDGWLLKAPRPERWYLKPPREAQIRTTPLARAAGRDVHALLPAGPDSREWRTRLSELQILLHTSSVNAAREARGLPPANSVWFWGGGRLPQLGTVPWTEIWSGEPLASGLARLAGLPSGPLPANGTLWCDQMPSTGNALLVLDQMAPFLLQGDARGWQEALQRLDSDWITPLRVAVHERRLASLTLIGDTGPEFSYRHAHRWRFWRRRPALSALREAG